MLANGRAYRLLSATSKMVEAENVIFATQLLVRDSGIWRAIIRSAPASISLSLGVKSGMRLAETLRRGPPRNEFKGYLSTLAQDLRYGYRQFRAAPAKAIIAIASLAIGIENLVHALARALCRHCALCLSDWVYSITSQSVSERNKEIGIRIALGSSKRSILGLFFRQASLSVPHYGRAGCSTFLIAP